ncbi:14762_t:CDS:10 [Acaulospora morrowiae]|uniref:sterol 3beta-glucosyltransferase n=1 Tax=Acaulospora morrowiae TaxID=94023 RepID=A0A9N9FLW0_9GLOM|nr:14762_t:CDS:10 [Acaulospora morrowiae]
MSLNVTNAVNNPTTGQKAPTQIRNFKNLILPIKLLYKNLYKYKSHSELLNMFNSNLISALNAYTMGAIQNHLKPPSSENKSGSEDSDSDTNLETSTESSLEAIYLTHLIQEFEQKKIDDEETIPKVKKLLKEKNTAEKLQEIFNLEKLEQLKGEFRCTFLRSIMLQGIMFLTENHICFHAYFPREQGSDNLFFKHRFFFDVKDVVLMDGNLWKRSAYGKYDRYYFSLQNDILTYYEDPMDLYCPVEIIDLKYALRVEKSTSNKKRFKLVVPHQTYKFMADYEQSMKEWVTQLERSIVRANNDGDNVKVVIPIDSVESIVDNLSMNFPNTIQINSRDPDDPSSYEEYFFVFSSDSQTLFKNLNELWKSHESLVPPKSNPSLPNSPTMSTRLMDSLKKSISIHGRSKNYDETSPNTHRSLSRSPKPSDLTLEPFSRRVSVFFKNPAKYISTFDENPSEETNEHFRHYFALKNEKLDAVFYGYYLRMIPLYGKFFISENYVCFKSRVLGVNTNIMLPILDVHFFKKQKATMLGYYGLEILTKAQQDMFFEFGFMEIRDRFVEILEYRINILQNRNKRSSSDGQALIQQAIIKDQLLLANVFPISPTASNFSDNVLSKPMHITCLTIGSRGDVQPYIALAKGLIKQGHKVRIATHEEYKDWVESHGIEFGYVGGNPAELMRICVENGMFTFGFFKEGMSNFRVWLDDLLETSWKACQNTDLIIESPSAMSGIHIAEALGIPYFRAFTMPWTRTRAYPHAFAVPDHDLKAPYNYSSYVLIENAFWLAIAPQVNRWRKHTLKLRNTSMEKMDPSTVPFLYNFSKCIVPKANDWADWVTVTGYWFLDNPDIGWEAPKGLLEFIDKNRKDGRKVVYIGFGSIVVDDPKELTKTIVNAVVISGVAAILSKGWSDRLQVKNEDEIEEPLPSCIYPMKSVPHDWLFPRVDAVVHHGGAGTTAAGLRAGVPTIIKPFFGDQFFWGDRIENMEIGFSIKKLTVDKLSDYLKRVVTDQKIIEKAKLVGENIRKEDGVENAIQAIYKHLEHAKQRIKLQKERTAGGNSMSLGSVIPDDLKVDVINNLKSISLWKSPKSDNSENEGDVLVGRSVDGNNDETIIASVI